MTQDYDYMTQSLIIKYSFTMTDIFQQTSLDSEFIGVGSQLLSKDQYVTVQIKQQHKKVRVFPWTTILDLKKYLAKNIHTSQVDWQNIKLFHKNIELADLSKNIHDYNILGHGAMVMELNKNYTQNQYPMINPYKLFDKPELKVKTMIQTATLEIKKGKKPQLTPQGTSGAYIISNKVNKKIAIFKPFDEEANAPNNPRGRTGPLGSDGICKGILSGECATREVAAYLLDSIGNGFHGVPTTTYIEFYHPSFTNKEKILKNPIPSQTQAIHLPSQLIKHGSLQQFINSEGIIGDFGIKRFTVEQIHKIAILDLRILNCDRNDGNILVRNVDNKLQLVPIDHGLSFPDNFQLDEDFIAWMNYPQARKPLSTQELQFIGNIDPIQDYKILSEKLGFRSICLRNFRIAETFLKKAVVLGFTLYEIGKMVYRTEEEDETTKVNRSELEKVVIQAENLYFDMQTTYFNLMELDSSDDELEDTSESMGVLQLRKKISLPQLKRKNTSFFEQRTIERKQREGINGVGKSVWNKYKKQQWSEQFYHYFENLADTFLQQKLLKQNK